MLNLRRFLSMFPAKSCGRAEAGNGFLNSIGLIGVFGKGKGLACGYQHIKSQGCVPPVNLPLLELFEQSLGKSGCDAALTRSAQKAKLANSQGHILGR